MARKGISSWIVFSMPLFAMSPCGGSGGLAHPLRHPAEAAPPFAVFEGWELGISGAKLLQKDRSIRVQGNEIIYLTLGPWTKPVQILVKPPAHLVFG